MARTRTGSRPEISIVTTMYYSAPYLEEFHRRVSAAAGRLTSEYEILFIDDGSPDDSGAIARRLRERDPRIGVLALSRNFGHHRAIMAGLSRARGRWVFLIDCDLEEPPELLVDFMRDLEQRPDVDVLYGVQDRRADPWTKRIPGALFWKLFSKVAGLNIPPNPCTIRLMTRRFVLALRQYREHDVFFSGVSALAGFNQETRLVNRAPKGTSTYSFRKRLRLAIDCLISFSERPLWMMAALGAGVSTICALTLAWFGYQKLVHNVSVPGWASIVVSIWALGGLTIGCLAFLGIYLAKIFVQVKGRPTFVAREWLRSGTARAQPSSARKLVANG